MDKSDTEVFNPAKHFYDNYKDDFLEILKVPLVAMCKESNTMIPYEYSDRQLRYRRLEEEVDQSLVKDGPKRLIIYCLNNKIDKFKLLSIAGGNLWLYDNMKKSFGGGNQ